MNLQEQIKRLTILVEGQRKDLEMLRGRVKELESENEELRRQLSQDSSNSSKPPSSDPIFKKSDRPVRKSKRKRNPGGQPGHKGNKLTKFVSPDFIEDHALESCPCCQSKDIDLVKIRSKQVVDIPVPKIEVTEHILYEYHCQRCGEQIKNPLAEQLKQEVQYGSNIKSMVNYLNVYQLIPYKRLTELIEVIYGHKISQGSISNFNKEMNDNLAGFIDQIKESLAKSPQALHSDETGCMVSKALHWVHVYSDKTRTLLQGHTKRGREAMSEIGILDQATGIFIHDRWSSYMGYDHLEHGLCNAHLIRELKGIEQNHDVRWPTQIKKILIRAKDYKAEKNLPLKRAQRLQRKYESILRGKRLYYQEKESLLRIKKPKGHLKRSRDHLLFLALWKYKKEILLFMYNSEVPFDNNQAERDLRMLKVKMKISNHFISEQWLNVHATIRSFISTAQKKKLDIMSCLQNAHLNPELATIVGV